VVERPDSTPLFVIPGRVTGVMRIPEPNVEAGLNAKRIFVVFEVPAMGGSNFLILNLQDNIYATRPSIEIDRLINSRVSLDWSDSNLDDPLPLEDFSKGFDFVNLFDGKNIADELDKHVGQMVMFVFAYDKISITDDCLQQVIEGKLISQNGQSKIDSINIMLGVIIPKKTLSAFSAAFTCATLPRCSTVKVLPMIKTLLHMILLAGIVMCVLGIPTQSFAADICCHQRTIEYGLSKKSG
jgi:hypothetical protein